MWQSVFTHRESLWNIPSLKGKGPSVFKFVVTLPMSLFMLLETDVLCLEMYVVFQKFVKLVLILEV
jgi:hypothetical protein